jgi:hypothetical protein
MLIIGLMKLWLLSIISLYIHLMRRNRLRLRGHSVHIFLPDTFFPKDRRTPSSA